MDQHGELALRFSGEKHLRHDGVAVSKNIKSRLLLYAVVQTDTLKKPLISCVWLMGGAGVCDW